MLKLKRAVMWSRSAGFTVLEALLATLVMGIVFAGLAMVTGQWLPNWDRGFARLQRSHLVAIGLDRVTDDLAAAEIISAGTGNEIPIYDGTEVSVIFVRTTLAPNAGKSLEVVQIAETSDDRGPALVRSTAALQIGTEQAGDSKALAFSNPVVVIRAARVAFSYAGPDRVWQDTWRGQPQLPRAVRVQLRDYATSTLLTDSTSTLIHAELPARCTWAARIEDCPGLGARAPSSGESDSGAVGIR